MHQECMKGILPIIALKRCSNIYSTKTERHSLFVGPDFQHCKNPPPSQDPFEMFTFHKSDKILGDATFCQMPNNRGIKQSPTGILTQNHSFPQRFYNINIFVFLSPLLLLPSCPEGHYKSLYFSCSSPPRSNIRYLCGHLPGVFGLLFYVKQLLKRR